MIACIHDENISLQTDCVRILRRWQPINGNTGWAVELLWIRAYAIPPELIDVASSPVEVLDAVVACVRNVDVNEPLSGRTDLVEPDADAYILRAIKFRGPCAIHAKLAHEGSLLGEILHAMVAHVSDV